jgi:putative SOS response-associated peptidase YedK
MCNLYAFQRIREEVRHLFRIADNRAGDAPFLPAIFPGQVAPVVRLAADGERELVTMSWGFVLLLEGKAPLRVSNVRDDKIRSSNFWRPSFEERRCLVPASSFCEPKGVKPAIWHWFALRGGHPRTLFAFAGIWRNWTGPIRKDGPNVAIETYSILTTKPNSLVSKINHDRMPVLLTRKEEFEQWLKGTPQEAFAMARQYPARRMWIVQEGFAMLDHFLADGPPLKRTKT